MIDFSYYENKFKPKFDLYAKRFLSLNYHSTKNWHENKTLKLKSHSKHSKQVIKKAREIEETKREDRISYLRKWDIFKHKKNETIKSYVEKRS